MARAPPSNTLEPTVLIASSAAAIRAAGFCASSWPFFQSSDCAREAGEEYEFTQFHYPGG